MSTSLTLVLTMLRVALIDGPKEYGSVINAIEDIKRTAQHNRVESITLGQLDSILRENNVDVEKLEGAYVGRV
jgi:hypothetical protein